MYIFLSINNLIKLHILTLIAIDICKKTLLTYVGIINQIS